MVISLPTLLLPLTSPSTLLLLLPLASCLHLEHLHRGKILYSATLSWPPMAGPAAPQGLGPPALYTLQWGATGGPTASLLTNSTSATVSLRPDTTYTITLGAEHMVVSTTPSTPPLWLVPLVLGGLVLVGVLVLELVRLVKGWCGGVEAVEVLVERVKEIVKRVLTKSTPTTSPEKLTQAGIGERVHV